MKNKGDKKYPLKKPIKDDNDANKKKSGFQANPYFISDPKRGGKR
jgi:hypothetical protein